MNARGVPACQLHRLAAESEIILNLIRSLLGGVMLIAQAYGRCADESIDAHLPAGQHTRQHPTSVEEAEALDSIHLRFSAGMKIAQSGAGRTATLEMNGKDLSRMKVMNSSSSKSPSLGKISVGYESGTSVQREARMVPSPTDPAKPVLEFWVQEPNVVVTRGKKPRAKSRIQLDVNGNQGVFELYESVRLYLGRDFLMLKEYPDRIPWFTISEWWNNAGWTGEDYPFRISVNITKETSGHVDNLRLRVAAQVKSSKLEPEFWDQTHEVWSKVNEDFDVPIDQWMRLEYYFKEGGKDDGRFVLVITPEGKPRAVIFDITGYTRHPQNSRSDGLKDLNPIKLYTSDKVTTYVQSKGGSLRMYWDDLQLLACGQRSSARQSICGSKLVP